MCSLAPVTCEKVCLIIVTPNAIQYLLPCHLCCDTETLRYGDAAKAYGCAPLCTSVGARWTAVCDFFFRRPTMLPNCSAPYQTAFRPIPKSFDPICRGLLISRQSELLIRQSRAHLRCYRNGCFPSALVVSVRHTVQEERLVPVYGSRPDLLLEQLVACQAGVW